MNDITNKDVTRPMDPPPVPFLMKALKDQKWSVRHYAAGSLVKIGPPAVPALIAALNDKDLTGEAAEALGRIGDPQAIPALVQALNGTRTQVKEEAARSLLRIVRRRPDPALRAALPALRRLWGRASVFHQALDEIEAATAAFRDLPVPAVAPPPDARSLPRPADAAVSPGAAMTTPGGIWARLRRALAGS